MVASLALVVPASLGVVFISAGAAPPKAAPAVTNQDCTIIVPPHPLTAKGLATPYRLMATDRDAGPCNEVNPSQSAFVQATIIDPGTGQLSVYNPLVIDAHTTPAVPPVLPTLPPNAVVGIWFGFNGNTLLQRSSDPTCVNGLTGSPFGQVSYCNAPAFFAAAQDAIKRGKLAVPPLGKGKDGLPCPTVRDFGVVDQDQSDNVTASYLATPDGRTAQDTAAASAHMAHVGTQSARFGNGSDNRLLDRFIDPALGCAPFTAPDLANGGAPVTSQALNELQAAAYQAPPVALVPMNDPMTEDNGQPNLAKTNAYRAGVDQPPLNTLTALGNGAKYCDSLLAIAPARLRLDKRFTRAAPSPDPASGLYDFLVARLKAAVSTLGCRPVDPGADPDLARALNAQLNLPKAK
jgi:hypothetical protein